MVHRGGCRRSNFRPVLCRAAINISVGVFPRCFSWAPTPSSRLVRSYERWWYPVSVAVDRSSSSRLCRKSTLQLSIAVDADSCENAWFNVDCDRESLYQGLEETSLKALSAFVPLLFALRAWLNEVDRHFLSCAIASEDAGIEARKHYNYCNQHFQQFGSSRNPRAIIAYLLPATAAVERTRRPQSW